VGGLLKERRRPDTPIGQVGVGKGKPEVGRNMSTGGVPNSVVGGHRQRAEG